jgi:hypothetical protein
MRQLEGMLSDLAMEVRAIDKRDLWSPLWS